MIINNVFKKFSLNGNKRFVFTLFSVWNLFGLLSSQKGEISELTCIYTKNKVVIKCKIGNIDENFLWKALNAGENLEFQYKFELYKSRKFWFNSEISSFFINKYLSYNSLTKQFIGKSEGNNIGLHTTRILQDFSSAVEWLSIINDSEFAVRKEDLENKDVFVQCSVSMARSRILFLLPYEIGSNSATSQVLIR